MFLKKNLLAGLFLFTGSILLTAGEKELSFQESLRKLKSWQKNMISVDRNVTLNGKESIHLQKKGILSQTFVLEKDARYELTYFVKGSKVEGGSRKGTLVMLHAGKGWSRITASPGNKPDSGTFDWRKGQGIVDCAALGGNSVKIFLAIRGEGEAWYNGLRLKKLPPSPEKVQQQKRSFHVEFFPANMNGNKILFCEGLPGMMEIVSRSRVSCKGKKGSLTILTPSYVKLLAACETLTLSRKKKRIPEPLKYQSIMRNGKKYHRYILDYSSVMLEWINMSWYRHILYFEVEKGSAGKKDPIFFSAVIGNELQKEQSLSLEILPPVPENRIPCKEFAFWINRIQSRHVPVKGLEESYLKFWSSLSRKRYAGSGHDRDRYVKYPSFERTLTVGGNHFYHTLTYREAEELKKVMPRNVKEDGSLDHRNYISVWAMVDDPDGHYEKYLRTVLRKLKAHFGPVKHLWWDFEPHPWGYDEGGRKRFAAKTGLKKVPSVEEIRKKYPEKWFQYMVKLHAELVKKNVRIIREELPGVIFWYCSDNLHAVGPRLARWCGIDVSLSDDVIDIHNHMPYYASTRYFDDMAYNVSSLKKPYFPLIDPAERSHSFYSQYSAPKVFQNIVATAALGGMGIGFWPDDVLQGDYYHAIARGFSFVASVEDFYRKGKRCDKDFTVKAKNAVIRRLAGGKEISYPDFSAAIRFTAHRLNGKTLVTLFNYDKKKTLIAGVQGQGLRPFLVKVGPEDCVAVRCDRIPDQKPLLREIRRFSGDKKIFEDQTRGGNSLCWNSTEKGTPVLEMRNGSLSASVDAFRSCHIVSFRTAGQKEFFHDGFAGCLMFNDASFRLLPFRRTAHGFTEKSVPFVEVEALIPRYTGGASSVPHPLYGLIIRRRMELHKDALRILHTFRNTGTKAVQLSCRLNNYPAVGHRFKAENVFLGKYDRSSPMEVRFRRKIRKGERMELKASGGGLSEWLTFVSGSDFADIFSWTQRGAFPRKTVEYMVEESVKPSQTLVKEYWIIPGK